MKTVFKPREAKGLTGKITLTFNYGTKKRFRYSTGLTIQSRKNWDFKKNRIKNVVAEPFRIEINNKLNELQNNLEKQYHIWKLDDQVEVSNLLLRDFCDNFFNKKQKEESKVEIKTLLQFHDWFLNNYSKKPLPTTGRSLANGTIRTYKNTLNILKRFNREVYDIDFNDITLEFYDDFIEWLYDQGYSNNYIGTIIKILKTVMNAAFEKGLHNSLDYKKRIFKKPTEEVFNIYLTEDEIERIENVDLEKFQPKYLNDHFYATEKKMKQARDLFLLSCYTGLRVSDFNKLTSDNIKIINKLPYLSLTPQKTRKPLTLPIHKIVRRILDKHEGNPPPPMPNQHINYCIKHLGFLAEINDEVSKTVTKGGKPITTTYKKYEMIMNHTGRRSLVTNAYKNGMPIADIMVLSGHSSEKMLRKYLKLGDQELAQQIGNHKFFQ